MTRDPFDTAAIRERVLAGWSASAARFREDANVEEDYALGGYRDRLVVELAQNAVDAAGVAGVPAVLELVLDGGVLRARNTGAPLDAAGVRALCTMRASAKRDGSTVGRFGVGFAATLAVTDTPAIASTTGAVRWSAEETRALVGGVPALAEELGRRGGHVPVLRLPFADDAAPPEGWTTEVTLPLRDDAAERLARDLLAGVDVTLLLVLPGLASVTVEVDGRRRTLAAADLASWRAVRRTAALPPALLADRPVEERSRTTADVLVAVPTDDGGDPLPLPSDVPHVFHAPTPTDEPLGLGVVVSAGLPLDPSRRTIAPGPLRDAVLGEAARAYAELLTELPPSPATLGLVPTGLAAGEADAVLRRALAELLPESPLLQPVDGERVRGRDAVVVDVDDDRLVAVLGDVVPGLLPAWYARASHRQALDVLGVRRVGLAELVELLAGLDRPPAWWHDLYDALAGAVPPGPGRDALGVLPVPLADGRLVRGPRGAVVVADAAALPGLDPLGVRQVHPEAAHRLLVSLGAREAGAAELLDDAAVLAAVAASYDEDDPAPVADAVLGLVAAAGLRPGAAPQLGELALMGDDGEWYPASELLLPGSALAQLVTDDAPFGTVDESLVERWGVGVLRAVGVLDGFATLQDHDVLADPDATDHSLDAEAEWYDLIEDVAGGPAVLDEMRAVRDLELVDGAAWPQALRLLATPDYLAYVVEPVHVLTPDGRHLTVPSYTAWWVARHAEVRGHRIGDCAAVDAEPIVRALYEPLPIDVPAALAHVLGVRREVADLAADPERALDALERLGDERRDVPVAGLPRAYAAIVRTLEPVGDAPLPELVRTTRGVVPRTEAVVADAYDLLPLLGTRPVVPVSVSLAEAAVEVLGVAAAGGLAAYDVVSAPSVTMPWSDLPRLGLALERAGAGLPPDAVLAVHDRLVVHDVDGAPRAVGWRASGATDHVQAGDAGALGRALAARLGVWDRRQALAEVFGEGSDEQVLRAEDALGSAGG